MRKYLKNIEDIEALRNTDTTIYVENNTGYYKFINGVLCFFGHDSTVFYNATIDFDQVKRRMYIEVKDEPSEDWMGKFGWFWDCDVDIGTNFCILGRLGEINEGRFYPVDSSSDYYNFRPLTPEEVEKYTGYKVVEDK